MRKLIFTALVATAAILAGATYLTPPAMAAGVTAACLSTGYLADASHICFRPNLTFSGATPDGDHPWILAEITTIDNDDAGTDSVKLVIQANLTGDQKADGIYLNSIIDSSLLTFAFVPLNSTGPTNLIVTHTADCCQADGDGKYDIRFSSAQGNAAGTLNGVEYVEYTITGPGALDALTFNDLSDSQGNGDGGTCGNAGLPCTFRIAAHVTGGTGGGGWIGGRGNPAVEAAVPSPISVLLLGAGITGMGVVVRRTSRKK